MPPSFLVARPQWPNHDVDVQCFEILGRTRWTTLSNFRAYNQRFGYSNYLGLGRRCAIRLNTCRVHHR